MFIVSDKGWTVLPYKTDIKVKPTDSKRVKEAARSKDIWHVVRRRETPSAEGLYELFMVPKLSVLPSSCSLLSLTLASVIKAVWAVPPPGEGEVPTGTHHLQHGKVNKCTLLLPSACSKLSCPGEV